MDTKGKVSSINSDSNAMLTSTKVVRENSYEIQKEPVIGLGEQQLLAQSSESDFDTNNKKREREVTMIHGEFFPEMKRQKSEYLPLKLALEEWVNRFEDEEKDKIKKLAKQIFSENISCYEPEKFGIVSYSSNELSCLDSIPNLTQCKITEIILRGIKIRNSFFDCFPSELVDLSLMYTSLNDSSDIVCLLCRFVNLETLILKGNELTDLPIVSPDHALKELDLSHNAICNSSQEKKNLLCYPYLSRLFLNNNPLRYIPRCSYTLKMLYVNDMNLQDDGVSALKDLYILELLDISNNRLTTLPEISSRNIQHLNFRNNQLKNKDNDLSLEKFPNLCYLELSGNQLTNIPPVNNNVQYLYLNNNQLVSNASVMLLEDLINLEVLELRHNSLTDFPFNFSCILRRLDISGNNITHYDNTKRMVSERLKVSLTNNPVIPNLSELRLLAPSGDFWVDHKLMKEK